MVANLIMESATAAKVTKLPSQVFRTGHASSLDIDTELDPFVRPYSVDPAEADCMALRIIGLGSCGTVFELPGTTLACKKGAPSVWTDFCLTNTMHQAVSSVRIRLQHEFPRVVIPKIPLCHSFHPIDDDAFWDIASKRLPSGHQTRQPLFTVDRIHPLPIDLRQSLIAMYFDQDKDVQQTALQDPDNADCLVRVYLGERESADQESDVYDSLRNFPLRLNMIEELDFNIFSLATEMALGLAILHWQARIDGMDVEFVLGRSSACEGQSLGPYCGDTTTPYTALSLAYKSRAVHLWILDYDKATQIQLTTNDIRTKLVPAFLGNDPYFPRPQVDEKLWDVFCDVYLRASRIILVTEDASQLDQGLPQLFLDEVLKMLRENEHWNEQDNIVFA